MFCAWILNLYLKNHICWPTMYVFHLLSKQASCFLIYEIVIRKLMHRKLLKARPSKDLVFVLIIQHTYIKECHKRLLTHFKFTDRTLPKGLSSWVFQLNQHATIQVHVLIGMSKNSSFVLKSTIMRHSYFTSCFFDASKKIVGYSHFLPHHWSLFKNVRKWLSFVLKASLSR